MTHSITSAMIQICKIINSINIDPIEYIGVEITIKSKTFVIFSVYIPPEVPSNIIKEKLDLLQPIITNFKNVIFCGDMNIRHALWDNNCRTNSKKSKIFLNFLNDSNLITLNSGEHTHISHNSLTAIDISALSPNLIDYFDWAVHDETGGGDHRLITIVNSELEIENDSFKIIKKHKVINEIQYIDFQNINNFTDFIKPIKNSIDKNTITIKSKHSVKKWWTDEINEQNLIKRAKLKVLNTCMTYNNFIEFKQANSKLKKMILEEKRKCWLKFCENINPQTNINEIWKKISFITNKKKKNNGKAQWILSEKKLASEFLNYNFPTDSLVLNSYDEINSQNINRIQFTLEDFRNFIEN